MTCMSRRPTFSATARSSLSPGPSGPSSSDGTTSRGAPLKTSIHTNFTADRLTLSPTVAGSSAHSDEGQSEDPPESTLRMRGAYRGCDVHVKPSDEGVIVRPGEVCSTSKRAL